MVSEHDCRWLKDISRAKQYHNTIWVPKLAYPTDNFLSNNTSQFLTNIFAETADKPSAATQHKSAPETPASASLSIASAPLCPVLALRHHRWVCVSLRRACASPLALCVSNSEDLHSPRLPLHRPAWADWLFITLPGYCAALSALSLPLCLSVLKCPSAASPDH